MAHKFVIHDGTLMLGDVELHEQLVRGQKGNTIGGGYWYIDHSTKTAYFYGSSHKFGHVTREEFEAADKQLSLSHFRLVFSEREYLNQVLDEEKSKKL
jgi:hypothetical protein